MPAKCNHFSTFSPFPLVGLSSILFSGHPISLRASCIEACTYFIPNGIFLRVPWPSDGVCIVILSWHPVCLKAGVVCTHLKLRPTFVLFPIAHTCARPGVSTHV